MRGSQQIDGIGIWEVGGGMPGGQAVLSLAPD